MHSAFWSTIVGAIVGAVVAGCIAYLIQISALREAKRQRSEDLLQRRQGLGLALLFKVIQIHSNCTHIAKLAEEVFERGTSNGMTEPWQFVIPPANIYDSIHFAPEEMAMLLGLKDNETFNKVADLDVKHNSLIQVMTTMAAQRRALGERAKPISADGNRFTVGFDRETHLMLRPLMIEVNDLFEFVRSDGRKFSDESHAALNLLNDLLRERLNLRYTLTPV